MRCLVVLLALISLGCGAPPRPGAPHCSGVAADHAALTLPDVDFDASDVSRANLRVWIEALAAPELRGRHATSDEARRVAALLARHMAALSLAAPAGDGSYCRAFPLLGEDAFNVVGHLEAAAEGAAVVLGAHYDGQGLHPAGFVYPSADDNASGVAALLEVARLARLRPWPFDLVFMALTGEEIGQVGAEAWITEPTVTLEDVRLMVNFDMVGRPWPGTPAEAVGYEALGDGAAATGRVLARARAVSGIEIRRLTELFTVDELRSDSAVFQRHVPTLYLSTGLHEDYHQRTDTAELVDVEQTARAVRLALSLLEQLAGE